MSLLVLDPDIVAAKALAAQLSDLEFNTTPASSTAQLPSLCHQGVVNAVIIQDEALLADQSIREGVPIILIKYQLPSADELLALWPQGVNDVWVLSEVALGSGTTFGQELAQRLASLSSAFYHQRDAINETVDMLQSEIERDQQAGQYIQMGMLPENPLQIDTFRLQHKVEPSLILSGDFIDYFRLSERYFACYIADVSGHGASSAFVTVLLKNFSRRLRQRHDPTLLEDPAEVLAWVNRELLEQKIDKHVAVFFAIVDIEAEKLRYANAAQFPPAMLIQDNQLVDLSQKGKPLGLFPEQVWESRCVDMPKGAKLVVCSDGVLDLLPGKDLTAKEAVLHEIVRANDDLDAIWAEFDLSSLGVDDVSCLVVTNTG